MSFQKRERAKSKMEDVMSQQVHFNDGSNSFLSSNSELFKMSFNGQESNLFASTIIDHSNANFSLGHGSVYRGVEQRNLYNGNDNYNEQTMDRAVKGSIPISSYSPTYLQSNLKANKALIYRDNGKDNNQKSKGVLGISTGGLQPVPNNSLNNFIAPHSTSPLRSEEHTS